MKIQHFADLHRLHTRIDSDATKIILGRYGQIYEWGDGLFGVMIIWRKNQTIRKKYWGYTRSALKHAGCNVIQNGDYEGAATFNPNNPAQSSLAIKAAGIKRKKILSETERSRLQLRMRTVRTMRRTQASGPSTDGKPRQIPPDKESGGSGQVAKF
jgi:hypothetical protein